MKWVLYGAWAMAVFNVAALLTDAFTGKFVALNIAGTVASVAWVYIVKRLAKNSKSSS